MRKSKNLLTSKTVWGAVTTLALACLPLVQTLLQEQRSPTSGELSELTLLLVSTLFTIYGRYSATQMVHTPLGFPGRNPQQEI